METHSQYKARILGLVEGKDPVAVQRSTAQQLADLVDGIPSAQLGERATPEKWSVTMILAHFAEAEVCSTWRYRQMIEHDGTPLPGYDQAIWEALGDYGSRSPQESLQLFRLLRQGNLQMFDRLTAEQWQRHGIHAERGRMSVRDLAVQIAGHDLNHLAQIRAILKR